MIEFSIIFGETDFIEVLKFTKFVAHKKPPYSMSIVCFIRMFHLFAILIIHNINNYIIHISITRRRATLTGHHETQKSNILHCLLLHAIDFVILKFVISEI